MEDSFQTFSALIQEMTSKFLNVNGTWINLFFWEGQGLAASARNWTFLMFLYRAPRCMPQLQFVLAHTSSRQPNCHWTSDSKGLRIENEHPNPGFVRMQILKSWHWTLGPQGRSYSEDIAWQFTHLFAPFLQGSRTEVPCADFCSHRTDEGCWRLWQDMQFPEDSPLVNCCMRLCSRSIFLHNIVQKCSKQVMSLPYLQELSRQVLNRSDFRKSSCLYLSMLKKKTIYSWLPRQPINPTHYFTKKLHPYDSPQICIRSSHCCQLITSHWTSVSDQQKEEMRRQRWGFPPKDFKVQ